MAMKIKWLNTYKILCAKWILAINSGLNNMKFAFWKSKESNLAISYDLILSLSKQESYDVSVSLIQLHLPYIDDINRYLESSGNMIDLSVKFYSKITSLDVITSYFPCTLKFFYGGNIMSYFQKNLIYQKTLIIIPDICTLFKYSCRVRMIISISTFGKIQMYCLLAGERLLYQLIYGA